MRLSDRLKSYRFRVYAAALIFFFMLLTATSVHSAYGISTNTPSPTMTPTPGPSSTLPLEVQYMAHGAAETTDELEPFLKIFNNSSSAIPLSQLKLRYWFTRDTPRTVIFGCMYSDERCSNITATITYLSTPLSGADTYAEIGFISTAPSLAPFTTTGQIEFFLRKDDWSNFTQSNDYSFDASKVSYADWSRVTLYNNGVLVWGTEPPALSSATATPMVSPTNTFVPPSSSTPMLTSSVLPPTRTPSFTPSATVTLPPTATISPPTATLSVSNTPGPAGFEMQYMAANAADPTDELNPYFKIFNNTGNTIPLSQLKLRYWFTRDTARPMVFGCAYSDVKCANIIGTFTSLSTPVNGADTYAEIGFTSTAGNLSPFSNSGQIEIFLHKDDWSNFTQSNDYSFDATKVNYADWSRVTLYNNGVLVWGTEPPGASPTLAPTSTFAPPTPTLRAVGSGCTNGTC